MGVVKQVVKAVTPDRLVQKIAARRAFAPYKSGQPSDVFSTVYHGGVWGDSADGFSSGSGSHDPELFGPYVAAVTEFLASLPSKPDVVDLGCGDFNIGSHLRPFAAAYTGCDVVPTLIERNRAKFADLDVEFRVVDIAADPLPAGDVVVIRQVLQHLSNDLISRVVAKLPQYTYAVISEHVSKGDFTPNIDMPTGPFIRTGLGSGIDLLKPPFSLASLETREICQVPEASGVIKTTVYRLK